jgi:uncharacterized protein YqjF (DUF2071 family)
MGGVFLTAEWRDIVMLNYEVAPESLMDLVPAGTELDLFQGKTLVSVVGFRFLDTRVRGLPIPWHRNFDEVNLRFYVRLAADPSRRGVVFVKEIVPRRAIAWVARVLYNENYHAHPMSHAVSEVPDGRVLSYELEAGGRRHALRATTEGTSHSLVVGTEEDFIAEHYYGYARQRDGGTLEYRVDHPAWQVYATRAAELDFDVAALYGERFAEALRGTPRSALIADGSAVSVANPVRVRIPADAPARGAIEPA